MSLLSENGRNHSHAVSLPIFGERNDGKQLKMGELYNIQENNGSFQSATSHTCTDKTDELDEDFENVPEHSKSLVND